MNNPEQTSVIPRYLIKRGELMPAASGVQPVPLIDWQQTQLSEGGAGAVGVVATGVSLTGDADLFEAGLIEHLDKLELIAIRFSAFTDGRGFSLAAQLRQYGFKGELRATGAILMDQLHYLQRCGFDAFELDHKQDAEVALEALGAFTKAYQPGW